MKRITLVLCSATVLLFSCNSAGDDSKTNKDSATTTSTEKKEVAPMAMPDSATMMKNWQAYSTPGDVQKMIASWDGTWASEVTMWEPGKPEQKSVGTTVNKMIMGGRYQDSHNSGNMMGMPFEGHGMLGYNNATKMLETTWIDNMGTGIMTMKGTWDSTSKSANFTGKGVDPMTLTERDYRETFKVIDDNTQMMEMYGPGPDGKEYKMMAIKFTRKK